jgi:hypothetical protein
VAAGGQEVFSFAQRLLGGEGVGGPVAGLAVRRPGRERQRRQVHRRDQLPCHRMQITRRIEPRELSDRPVGDLVDALSKP